MTSANNILVSVIIPTYKTCHTLKKSVDSALSQFPNSPQSVEVIIIDDCSPDDGFQFAQQIAETDSRIRLYQTKENMGCSGARNIGLENARGTWIAILDNDDWFEDNRLETLINGAVKHNVEMAADNIIFFDKIANQRVANAFLDKGRKQILTLDKFLRGSNATRHFDYGMLQPVVKTDFIRTHKIEYYSPARTGEDFYFLLEFFAHGGRAFVTDTPYYTYVQPFGSISGQAQNEGRTHYNHNIQKMIHQRYFELLHDNLNNWQIRQLERRAKEIEALIVFYDIKNAILSRKPQALMKLMFKTNTQFWQMIIQKAMRRIRIRLLGMPSYIVSDPSSKWF